MYHFNLSPIDLSMFWPPTFFLISTSFCLALHGVHGVFFRNIPFRYKSAERRSIGEAAESAEMMSGEERSNGKSIQGLLDNVEAEETRLLLANAEQPDADGDSRLLAFIPKSRIVRLIPLRSAKKQQPRSAENDGTNEQKGNGGRSVPPAPMHHHSLIALRPDYAFRNAADFLRNFFDSRIERSRKNVEDSDLID